MIDHTQPLEMHIHGQVPLRVNVTPLEIEVALKPLKAYNDTHHAAQGMQSLYEEEPGIGFDEENNTLHFCWSLAGDSDFRETLDELVMGLNELSREGATLEVSIYDIAFDDDDDDDDDDERVSAGSNAEASESRDDFYVLFIGPTPEAIMQVQRDFLVEDVMGLMERHFERDQMTGVVAEIDQLFHARYKALVNSLQVTKARSPSSSGGHGLGAHARKPRHPH